MRLVIQRVSSASVTVDKKRVAEIGSGMVALVGFKSDDAYEDMLFCANKLLNLRIFPSSDSNEGRCESKEQNVMEVAGELLLVSQFTLYGSCKKGNRPSFSHAMSADKARDRYNQFVELVTNQYPKVQSGIFQAYMQVELINDGPVTILLDSKKKF